MTRQLALMPVPAAVSLRDEPLPIDSAFRAVLTRHTEPRLERAVTRMLHRLSQLSGIPIRLGMLPDSRGATLEIEVEGTGGEVQSAIEDESYRLVVTADKAQMRSPTPYGALRGLETFLQLVEGGTEGFQVPGVRVEDHPRFPWRGLLIDAVRHWMPPEVIRRNLDGMAALKLNVLHWHLSDDQGFRIESKRFPKLHEQGSDGEYYTQEQVREIVNHARDLGIRVVPEFDMPGHGTGWFVGHPELASAPGPYGIEPSWGVKDPTMDPTQEEVYAFLDGFVGEMSALFPDLYFHIGGDEVSGKQWDANPGIQAFMQQHGMEDNHALQAYFNRRLSEILKEHGKKMIGWDEIFHPDLPHDIVIQSWRGQEWLAETAVRGYRGILSHGYYLDHIRPASFHYGVDPLGQNAGGLSEDQEARVLGGEACMWTEYVTAENVDSRIWPRTAAVAERLWSPAAVDDVDDMYRRLAVTSQRLEWLGLTHRSGYRRMLRRLANYAPIESLETLADVLQPLGFPERSTTNDYTKLTPLNRLVDAARPESDRARIFSRMVDEMLADPSCDAKERTVVEWLRAWRDNHAPLQPVIQRSFLLREAEPLSRELAKLARLGLAAVNKLKQRKKFSDAEKERADQLLERAAAPKAELVIMIVPAVRRLVEAAD